MNKVVLVGNVTKEIELQKVGENQTAKVEFQIAVNRKYKNEAGERITDFLRVEVWRGLAENVAKFVKKGERVAVAGAIQTDSYEKDGQKIYTTYIAADEVEFSSTKKEDAGEQKK